MHYFFLLLFLFAQINVGQSQGQFYKLTSGTVHFQSDAPLEFIEATSTQLKGVLDLEKNHFAFSVSMTSFEGFNSPLQRVHFNENYLESNLYPNSTYSGKIIERIDLEDQDQHRIRAKGKLTIHGVVQERIIPCTIRIEDNNLFVQSQFTVLLEEHDISIPRIVFQKISREIKVVVRAVFEPGS